MWSTILGTIASSENTLESMKREDGYYPYSALPLMSPYNAQDVVCAEFNADEGVSYLGYTDRMMRWNYKETSRIIEEHTGSGVLGLGRWVNTQSQDKVSDLMQELNNLHGDGLKVVGWRVVRYTNVSNGYATFSIGVRTLEVK